MSIYRFINAKARILGFENNEKVLVKIVCRNNVVYLNRKFKHENAYK